MTAKRGAPLVLLAFVAACSSSSSGGGAQDGAAGDVGQSGQDGGGGRDDGSADAPGDAARPGAGQAWSSGTRLRARVASAGSARLFVGWHDATLGVDCDYAVASDGKMRCLPGDAAPPSFYDDDKCSHAVGVVPRSAPTPKYLQAPSGPFVCGQGPDFYLPGAAYAPTAIYQFDGSGCAAAGAPSAAFVYLHPGARVDPTTFAGETDTPDARGARLSARQYVGDDGSRQDADLLDGARGNARCTVRDAGQGALSCVPSDLAYQETFFSDPTCKTPVGFAPGYAQQVCNRTPTAIQDSTMASIGKPLSLFEVGARITGTVYQDDGASCAAYVAPATLGASYYALGAVLPLSSLAPLSQTNEGSGRILLSTARTESGALAAQLAFFDTATNTTCRADLAADGQARCLPETPLGVNLFLDDQCTQGILEWTAGAAAPAAGTLARGQGPMPNTAAVYRIGAKTTAPAAAWQWNGDTCTVAGFAAGDDFYAATAVPPTDFVSVTTAVE